MRLRLGETVKVAHRGRKSLLLEPKICSHPNTTVYAYSGESTAKSKMRKPAESLLSRALQGIFVLQKLETCAVEWVKQTEPLCVAPPIAH